MRNIYLYWLYSILLASTTFLVLIFSAEFTVRILKLKHFQKDAPLQSKIDPRMNNNLKKIAIESDILQKNNRYPQLENEDLNYENMFTPELIETNDNFNLHPNTRSIAIVKSKISRTLIYRVKITTDSAGRRYTPIAPTSKSNIIFFGDSFTFGNGVNDNETFPYYLSLRRPKSAIYNLGLPGFGLNDILYDLQFGNNNRYKDIPKRETISVYTFIDDHLLRFFCGLECYRENNKWLLRKPMFDDNLNYKGTFADSFSKISSIYSILGKSQLLTYLNIQWPAQYSIIQFETFARAILKVKTLTEKNLGSKKFYFVFYPRYSSYPVRKALIPFLKKYGIKYLDYSNIEGYGNTNYNIYSIPIDNHPTPIAQYLIAYLIDKDLDQLP